jgi:hypothetical protein
MKLTDHVTLNFNNTMSTAAVFLDIEKAFDTAWHSDLPYKLSELDFSTRTCLFELIASYLTSKKIKVSIEDEFSAPREIAAGLT